MDSIFGSIGELLQQDVVEEGSRSTTAGILKGEVDDGRSADRKRERSLGERIRQTQRVACGSDADIHIEEQSIGRQRAAEAPNLHGTQGEGQLIIPGRQCNGMARQS